LSSADIEITKVRNEFLEAICEIERESFSEPYPHYILAAMATETPETFLVAVSNLRVVGYVLASLNKDSGHILSIAVRTNLRRRGIGSRLMVAILEALRKKGAQQVILEVRMSNLDARMFYEKLGFTEAGRVRAYYRDGEDALKMESRIGGC
jgi:ribosomal-protein-alanine N-acetyltransferase